MPFTSSRRKADTLVLIKKHARICRGCKMTEGGSAFTKVKRPRWMAKLYPVSRPLEMYPPGPEREIPRSSNLPDRRLRSCYPCELTITGNQQAIRVSTGGI